MTGVLFCFPFDLFSAFIIDIPSGDQSTTFCVSFSSSGREKNEQDFANRTSHAEFQLEVVLTDLRMKFPCLQYLLQPQYAPYLNTAGTVLLGWLIVSWISRIIWSFLAPLVVFVITIILICPTTIKWCFNQSLPSIEAVFHEFMNTYHIFLSNIQDGPKSNG